MDVVEVEHGGEIGLGGASEEVQATITGQQTVGLLHNRLDGGINEDIVEAFAAGQLTQVSIGIGMLSGVDIDQLHAVVLGLFHGEDLRSAGQTGSVHIGDHHQGGLAIAVDSVVDSAQTHGAGTGQDGHLTAQGDAHVMDIAAGGGVVVGMVAANDAAHGLSQGAVEVSLVVVGQQATALHNFVGDDDVGSVAADMGIGVAGSSQAALVVHGGLNGKLVAGLELVSPLSADFHDLAAELMADDHGVFCHIIGNTLVVGTLNGSLVGGHADAVGNDMSQDLIVLDLGKLELFQSQVVHAIDTNCFRLHKECTPM